MFSASTTKHERQGFLTSARFLFGLNILKSFPKVVPGFTSSAGREYCPSWKVYRPLGKPLLNWPPNDTGLLNCGPLKMRCVRTFCRGSGENASSLPPKPSCKIEQTIPPATGWVRIQSCLVRALRGLWLDTVVGRRRFKRDTKLLCSWSPWATQGEEAFVRWEDKEG